MTLDVIKPRSHLSASGNYRINSVIVLGGLVWEVWARRNEGKEERWDLIGMRCGDWSACLEVVKADQQDTLPAIVRGETRRVHKF